MHTQLDSAAFPAYTFRERLRLFWGKPRRLFLNIFRTGMVRENLALRKGKCHRCGACCHMGSRCRYFRYDDGIPTCLIYDKFRPSNCRSFPIDKNDLADRDLVSPYLPCGFWWSSEEELE